MATKFDKVLNADEQKEIARGLNQVLNTIIYDMVSGDESSGIKQAEVIEVCLDADYLETYGRCNRETVKKFRQQDYKKFQVPFAKTVFTFKSYGL